MAMTDKTKLRVYAKEHDIERRLAKLEAWAWGNKSPSVDALSCDFCAKPQSNVRMLIAGPTALICDECIDVCNVILAKRQDEADADPA